MLEIESGGQGLPRKERQGLPEANRRGNRMQPKTKSSANAKKGEKWRKNSSSLRPARKPIV
jgi:hypothetical protein